MSGAFEGPSNFRLALAAQAVPMERRCACFICEEVKPASHGGMNSTGDINAPVYRWICNECLKGKVCP